MKNTDLYRAIGEIDDDLIIEAEQPGRIRLKKRRTVKIIIIAAAVAVALSSAALASSGILGRRSSHSWSFPTYTSVPSAKKLQKDVGISPKILESFSNGYKFKNATIGHETDEDTDGNVMEKYKSIYCKYTKDNNEFGINIDAAKAGLAMNSVEPAETYDGVDIKYFSYTNKFVPGDYQLTEQDRADKESGKYVFSYGTEDIEIHEVQITAWVHNGLNHVICAMDSELAEDDLLQAAKEFIDYQ